MNQYPLIRGQTDLKARNPALAEEWDGIRNKGLTPEDVQPGSVKKVWWRCRKGHSWMAAVYSRTAGAGCPYCAGNRLIPGVNDLATVAPLLAEEWDVGKNGSLRPEDVAGGTAKRVWWRCAEGHSWQAAVSSRAAGKGCRYCAGRKVMPGFNDLATADPELTAQWDHERNGGLRPEDVTGMSQRSVWWTGRCGHSWKAKISNRRNGCGCPYCCGKKILEGFNDAQSRCPELMDEWDFEKNTFLPSEITAGSQKDIWWRCRKGHSWKAKLPGRRRGNGCPYCGNRKVLPGENDLASVHPELAGEWDYGKNQGSTPETVMYQTRKKVWWRCRKGHSWKAEVYERAAGSGCPVCTRLLDRHPVIPGESDLATYSPRLAREWDCQRNMGLTPEQVRPFSTRKVWWVCEKGHHWQCTVQVRQKGTGCPFCDGRIHRQPRLI